MVCKKLKKFATVFVSVVLVKITFSGLDVFSDGSTASELAGYGSPLTEAQRYAEDFVHNTTGRAIRTSHEISDLILSLETDLEMLINTTSSGLQNRTTFQKILSKLGNVSDKRRVLHEIMKLEDDIKKFLDLPVKENQTKYLQRKLSETGQNIKKILTLSAEEELVDILLTFKDKVYDQMEKQAVKLKKLFDNVTEGTARIDRFMNNSAYEINDIIKEAITESELVITGMKETNVNHLYLENTDAVVETLNTAAVIISKSFQHASQEIMKTQNIEDSLEQFYSLKGTVLLTMQDTVDRIIDVHPIWSSLTLAIMFLPGPVLALVFFITVGSELCDNIGPKLSNFVLFFYLPLVTLCFPVGVLFTPICQALAITTGANTLGAESFTFLTELAVALEAFLESAPQIILQLFIIYHSGIVSSTQLVSIFFSVLMVTKTALMFEIADLHNELSWKTKLFYLLIHLPLYVFSGYFRLGSIALSCIFFGYWTILPITVLFCLLCWAAKYLKFNEIVMTAPTNLFISRG